MRKLIIILFIVYANLVSAQTNKADSLQKLLKTTKDDTTRVNLLIDLVNEMPSYNDSAKIIIEQALQLSKKINFKRGEIHCYYLLAQVYGNAQNLPKILETLLNALELSKSYKDKKWEANITNSIAYFYLLINDNRKGLEYSFKARRMFSDDDAYTLAKNSHYIGSAYLRLNILDSALTYMTHCYQLSLKNNYKELYGSPLLYMGEIHALKNNDSLAQVLYTKAIQEVTKFNYNEILKFPYTETILGQSYLGLAKLFIKHKNKDSSYKYAINAVALAPDNFDLKEASTFLSSLYEADHNYDSALYYYKIAMKSNDSLFGPEKVQQVQNQFFNQQQRQQDILKQQQEFRTRVRIYVLIGSVVVFLVIAIFLWRNNRIKQKANAALHEKNDQLQSTLATLKSTQSRLIQTEKMASLGELTAGIAHEIQNPLNFINNFSEVNNELIEEMNECIDNGILDDVKAISSDIKDNNDKISYHGKRAEAIVKGMLQHSRQSTGKKESIDVNALIDEYLRLSYQGFRARDKSFNATIEKHFDESIGKIEVFTQELGRVLLNLFNNAFYSVYQKKQLPNINYEPVIAVRTWSEGDNLMISVKDNGNGIPDEIKGKIFQPFFTTKPTGDGTGLGLSLSFDIITKMHEGNLEVNTESGQFAEFVIQLPFESIDEV